MTPAQAEKARLVEENERAWDVLRGLHRLSFPDATHPGVVPAEPVPMFGVLLAQHERTHLAAVARLDRTARREARARARGEAEREALRLLSAGMEDWSARQAATDRGWADLMEGEPLATAAAVQAALTSRGADVEVASDEVGHVRLVLQARAAAADIPSHQPSVTARGLPTLKKLTKTETAHHFRQVVAAQVLLAAKEACAQSPAISNVSVTVREGRGVLLRASFSRASLASAPWSRSAWEVLEASAPDLEANVGGRTQELRPLK